MTGNKPLMCQRWFINGTVDKHGKTKETLKTELEELGAEVLSEMTDQVNGVLLIRGSGLTLDEIYRIKGKIAMAFTTSIAHYLEMSR